MTNPAPAHAGRRRPACHLLALACALLLLAPRTTAEWALVWAEEFDRPGAPDSSRWTYEVGRVRNREAQYYTAGRPENARVEDGELVITARRESHEGATYTSASVTSEGRVDFQGGLIEVRARVPGGRGTWPAIWTLGNDIGDAGWPLCGEIDVMEHVGHDPDRIHGNLHTAARNHTRGNGCGGSVLTPAPETAYHVYAVEWWPDRITFLLDGTPYHTCRRESATREAWPFDHPHYLLLNLAIGGAWGGQRGIDDSLFPCEFRIDWVRHHQWIGSAPPPPP